MHSSTSSGRKSCPGKATNAIVFSFQQNPPWSSSRVRACSIEDLRCITPDNTKMKEGDLVEIKYCDVYHPVLVQEIHEDSDIRVLIIGLYQEHGYYRETRSCTQAVTLGVVKEKRPYWACPMADAASWHVANTTVELTIGDTTRETLDVSHAKKPPITPAKSCTSSVSHGIGGKKGNMGSSFVENSFDDAEPPTKPSVAATVVKPAVPKSIPKGVPVKKTAVSSEESSDESDLPPKLPVVAKPVPVKAVSTISSDDSSDDDAPGPVKPVPLPKSGLPAKVATVKTVAAKKRGNKSSESGPGDAKPAPVKSTTVPKPAARGAKPVPAKGAPIGKKVVYEISSSTSDTSDDDKPVPVRSAVAPKLATAKTAPAKKMKTNSSEESSDDDKPAKSRPVKIAPVKKEPTINGKTAPAKSSPLKTVAGKRARHSSSEDSRDGDAPATKKPLVNLVSAMAAILKARSSSESSSEEEEPTTPEQPIKTTVKPVAVVKQDPRSRFAMCLATDQSGEAVKSLVGSLDSKASSSKEKPV